MGQVNDLIIVNDSDVIAYGSDKFGRLIKEDDIEFVKVLDNVFHSDFPFDEWEKKYVKLYIDGSFPLRVGDALVHKKSRIILRGFILGHDKMKNVLLFLTKIGNEMIYIPSIDGRLTLFEGRLKNGKTQQKSRRLVDNHS